MNLIAPMNINDNGFDKFHTDLGLAMKVLKYQNEGVVEVIQSTNHKKIDRATAVFLNAVTNLGLEFEEKDGGVDMCEALERRYKLEKILAVIDYMKDEGKSENDIITKIVEKFNVTKEYVLALLTPQKA